MVQPLRVGIALGGAFTIVTRQVEWPETGQTIGIRDVSFSSLDDGAIVGRALYENRFPCQQFWAWHQKETLDLERFSTAPLADEGR